MNLNLLKNKLKIFFRIILLFFKNKWNYLKKLWSEKIYGFFKKKICFFYQKLKEKKYHIRFWNYLKKLWSEKILVFVKNFSLLIAKFIFLKYKKFKYQIFRNSKKFWKFLKAFFTQITFNFFYKLFFLDIYISWKIFLEKRYDLLIYYFLKPTNIYKKFKKIFKNLKNVNFVEISFFIFEYQKKPSYFKKIYNLKIFKNSERNYFSKKLKILNLLDYFSTDETIKNIPILFKTNKFKKFFQNNIEKLFFLLQKTLTETSNYYFFEDYFQEFSFKNYLKNQIFVKKANSNKFIWNTSYYLYNEKLFWDKSTQTDGLEWFLYCQFNNICFSENELKNDFIYYVRNEFNGIKKLLDENEFPIFPLSSGIPIYLIKTALIEIKKLLDFYKIRKNFNQHKNIKDMFIQPYKLINFSDNSSWNISELVQKMKLDYSFLYKYLLLSEKSFYEYQDHPFNNFYERKYLNLSIPEFIWNKIQIFLANLYIVEPFSAEGEFLKFESLILKKPEKCLSYMNLLTRKSEQEYEYEIKKYFDSKESLYPKLPFELNFLNLECLTNFSLSIYKEKENKTNLEKPKS